MNTDKIELKEVVQALRKRAVESPAFNAIAHTFAMRERARQQVMLSTLYHTMEKEGFNFSRDAYAKELEFLSNLGIGKLEVDKKNRVIGLKKVGVTLQSIGTASLAKVDQLSSLKIHPRYVRLPSVESVMEKAKTGNLQRSDVTQQPDAALLFQGKKMPEPPKPKIKEEIKPASTGYKATLVIDADGKRKEIVLGNKISADMILNLIVTLQGGTYFPQGGV